MEEKEKVVRYIIEFGIKGAHHDSPELLNIKEWQDEIASKPFNLKQASEYLGVSYEHLGDGLKQVEYWRIK